MIILLGLLSFELLYDMNYDTAVRMCAIIGGIIAIPGGILGTALNGIMNFSLIGLFSSKVRDLLGSAFYRFIINALSCFFLPFIITALFLLVLT